MGLKADRTGAGGNSVRQLFTHSQRYSSRRQIPAMDQRFRLTPAQERRRLGVARRHFASQCIEIRLKGKLTKVQGRSTNARKRLMTLAGRSQRASFTRGSPNPGLLLTLHGRHTSVGYLLLATDPRAASPQVYSTISTLKQKGMATTGGPSRRVCTPRRPPVP